jgi:CheY-like chemotaxis protein
VKVMIVDDSATELALIARIVTALGHEAIQRSESLGTVSEVRRNRPDVVLLDLNMPGLRGDALAELILRPQNGFVPTVAFMSGATGEEMDDALKRAGVTAALRKSTPGEIRDQLVALFLGIERASGAKSEPAKHADPEREK